MHHRVTVPVLFCLAITSLLLVLGGCKDEKKEAAANADEALKSVGDGALTYYQEEHADTETGLNITTRVFPKSPERVCGGDASVWEELRYSAKDGVEVCYQSGADEKSFAASAAGGDKVLCLKGSDESGPPQLSSIETVDSADDCKP